MTNTEACLTLNLISGIGPVRVRRLLERFGSAPAILAAKASDLSNVSGVGAETAGLISKWEETIDLSRELRRIDELGLSVLTWEDELYPPLLKQIYTPPLVLYVLGEVTEKDRHGIAIVGSRRATHYGLSAAKKISYTLAHAGMTVVSGLARGIDTAAHEAAVAAGGRTIAVTGCGLGTVYPPENLGLVNKIVETGSGAIVSEFPVDFPPEKRSFPMRNRIVAGWSHGICVIEAPGRSGSLITANQAMEMGRSVYAVPGQIDRPTSHGSNRLIQAGAKLVMDGNDILDDLDTLFPTQPHGPTLEEVPSQFALSEDEKAVIEAVGTAESLIDEIAERSGLSISTVSSTLLLLQMKRAVKQLPGNYYVRLI
jgi:DNA processing protein